MKFFNSQNTSNSKWKSKEFLIYFLNAVGGFEVYRYKRSTGEYKPAQVSELLSAEKVYISYSYLGGIHISDYYMIKSKVGSLYTFTFTLRTLNSMETEFNPGGDPFWDIPNAIFLQNDQAYAPWRGVEPVKTFQFQILATNPNQIYSTTFTTFEDQVFSSGGRRFGTEIGVVEQTTTKHLALREHPEEEIIDMDANAMDSLFTDAALFSPGAQSYVAGHFESNANLEFSEDYDLLAAYPCFFRINNQWERRVYFIAEGMSNAFRIGDPPSQTCIGYYIRQLQPDDVVDYSQVDFFGSNTPIGYYQLDNLIS